MEPGYEDIYSDEPYIEVDYDHPCAYILQLYVPPHLRGQGEGTRLVKEALAELKDKRWERVRLRSAVMGSGDSMPFWRKFGFRPAYSGEAQGGFEDDLDRIMVRGINGNPTPPAERLTADNIKNREMHEGKEDKAFIAKWLAESTPAP